MSRWRTEPTLQLSVGAAAWQLTQAGRVVAGAAFATLEELAQGLGRIEGPVTGSGRLAVTVHEQWVCSFAVEPAVGTRSLRELKAQAQVRREQLFGTGAHAWLISAAWRAEGPFAATALPRPVVDAARALCGRMRWRLGRVVPAWIGLLVREPRMSRPVWWAIAQPGFLTLARTRGRRVEFVHSTRVDAHAPEPQLRAIAQRELQRSATAAGAEVRAEDLLWLTAGAGESLSSGALTHDHDAAHPAGLSSWPARGRSWPAWMALGALSVFGTFAAQRLIAADREHDGVRVKLAAVAAARPAAARPASAPAPMFSAREADAINSVTHRLNTPWPEVFAALERATPAEVSLLSMEPDMQQARLRASGRAKDERMMLDYVDRLATEAPFARVRVVRHEADTKDATRPLRFQVEVALATDAAQGATR